MSVINKGLKVLNESNNHIIIADNDQSSYAKFFKSLLFSYHSVTKLQTVSKAAKLAKWKL